MTAVANNPHNFSVSERIQEEKAEDETRKRRTGRRIGRREKEEDRRKRGVESRREREDKVERMQNDTGTSKLTFAVCSSLCRPSQAPSRQQRACPSSKASSCLSALSQVKEIPMLACLLACLQGLLARSTSCRLISQVFCKLGKGNHTKRMCGKL